MGLELAGKVIVIVGGTTGLGLSASRACVAAGAKVVAMGRNPQSVSAAQRELGDSARVISADATDPSAAANAIQTAVQDFGGFHGLYHVAGGSGRAAGDGPLHELTDDGWERTLQHNLTSLFYSNRAAAKQFLAQGGGGSVLNVSSVLGYSPSPKFFATHAYAAAKAAAIGFTKSCASYYADRDIRFNVIAPGLIATPMSERAQSDPNILKFIATKQPLKTGGFGNPKDLDA